MFQITAGIEGMSCEMCEAHVNDCIRNTFKVKKVTSSRKKKESVIICEDDIPEEELKAAVSSVGYNVTSIEKKPYEKKGLFSFGR